MCPARMDPPKDPRRRDPPRQPEPEIPPVILPEWTGVLLMANSRNTKIRRIARVACRPAPPVPLPERLQVKNEFLKLDVAEHQVCTGLPFFELHKSNFVYHPDSEWSKFLGFLHRRHRFATIVCDGWELLIRPPLVGPPHGFSSLRVHYRRKAESPTPVSLTIPGGADLVALSYQDWASDPSASGARMEVDSLEGPTDFTAKLSCQPKVKRSRVEGAFDGFRNTRTGAPSSSREKDLQEIKKLKSIGNCVTDISYDISPTWFDHVSQPSSRSDKKWDSLVADKGKSLSIQGVFHQRVPKPSSNGNGSHGNGAALGATPDTDWMKRYIAEAAMLKPPSCGGDTSAAEKCLKSSGSSQGVPNGVEAKVPEMVISDRATTLGAVPAIEDHRRNHVAEAAVVMLPPGASDISLAKKCLQASGSSQAIPNEMKGKVLEMIGSHEATSGPASVNDDCWQDALAKARSSGSDSGVMGKPSQVSGSAEVVKEMARDRPLGKLKDRSNGVNAGASKQENSRGPPYKCNPSDTIALRKSSQAKDKLKVDLTPQTGSQVADTGKAGSKRGPGVSLKKRVSKPSSNGNRKPVVRCIPCVPEAFRVNIKTSTEEQMSKPASSASGALQKQTCSQPEVKEKERNPNPTLLSSSFENSVKQKSLKDAVTINGDTSAPSSSSDRDSQQTCKSIVFTYGVTRSKPPKLKLKKSSTEGSLGAEVSASACDAKKEKNGWQLWLRVIHNILHFMYMAEERGATKVDVDVKEVYWSLGKRNVVAFTIADNGTGMSRKGMEWFCSAIMDNLRTHLILLTQTETEKLVGIIYKNELWAIFNPEHDEGVKKALDAVEAISPFNRAHIMSEFLKMDRRGMRIIIYEHEELVFKQPKANVKVENLVQTIGQNEDVPQVTNDFDMTKATFIKLLRIYSKAAYFEPQVMIHLQNKWIKKSLGEKLSAGSQCSRNYNLMIEKKEITLSISFKETYSKFDTYGICLYYRNRLIADCPPFWKVDQMFQDGNCGQGVVGVVDITCLMDCGDRTRINFKHNKHYNMLIPKLVDMVRDYCGNLDNFKNGGRKELNICNSSKVNLSEKLYKFVGNGTTSDDPPGKKQKARDISKGKICDNLKEVIPRSLHLPKIGKSSKSKPMIRSKECWKLGKLPFGTETDNLSADWSCGFPAEGTTVDEDDSVLLSELIRWTPNLVENNADGLENDETDYEPKDSKKEYEVEKIIGTFWVGCIMDGNPWKSTWEPPDNVCNAAQEIQECFLRNSKRWRYL